MFKQKEDLFESIKKIPRRKIPEMDKQAIGLLVEISKVQRERAAKVLDKGFMCFFTVVIIGLLSKVYNIVSEKIITFLFVFGIVVISVAMFSYHAEVKKEEEELKRVLEQFFRDERTS